MRSARPDRLRAMEILLEDLMQGQPEGPAAQTAS